ncbi:MAG: D-cysteine desulfhydrase family protein [Planctomycetes bacterium]|nr:D-cysteine desulfhydrase family protein [Planctomycetota bacterium]
MPVKHPKRIDLIGRHTPVLRLERLAKELGGAEIWLKRDDLTGLEVSGNKVRKLEYVAADALATGCDTLVTEGTPQSNHCRATAAVCARLGLRCHLLLRPAPPGGIPQGNHLLDTLFGAEVSSYPREQFDAEHDSIVAGVLGSIRATGHKPRFTPMGASEPLGCWGYIRAAAELADQLHQVGVGECDIVLPISSGGTYAGMLLGQWIHQLAHWNLWAVPVSDDVVYHTHTVGKLAQDAISEFKLPTEYDETGLQFIDGYVGDGYAIPYQAAIDAIRLLARTEAILLDPVYTGKAFCALLDGVREGWLGTRRPVVFIHTGGIFSNFAWPELLIEGVGT